MVPADMKQHTFRSTRGFTTASSFRPSKTRSAVEEAAVLVTVLETRSDVPVYAPVFCGNQVLTAAMTFSLGQLTPIVSG